MFKKVLLWAVIPGIVVVPLDVMSSRVDSRQLSTVLSVGATVLLGLWYMLLIRRSRAAELAQDEKAKERT